MAKLSRKEIKAKADAWALVQRSIATVTAKKEKELRPYVEEFANSTSQIRAKYDRQLEPLQAEAAKLQAEVIAWLETLEKAIRIETEAAVAANVEKQGSRVIDPQKYFDHVTDHTAEFWACVTIAVAKAQKLIGENAVNAISEKAKKFEQTLMLKNQ